MNATRKRLLIIAGTILLFGVSTFIARKTLGTALGLPDTKISRHANLAEVRKAGVIEQGWVPEILPAGSKDITETHNLDTNVGMGTFQFPSADLDAFKAQARQLAGAEVNEVSTITSVVYARDRSRFELVLTPDPKTAEAMIGVWNIKPVR
ncbi:MAG: hypothetical protein EBU04_04345 [Verrucomicrobia bacterium]|nr:hypothetical protein [Verrucomicrobiota bacterium]NBS04149.1 hypothetical protein [Verrucomicrobiota bacterium]NBY36476.1 hypothetical protein [Verrucomicrobiota bacterium]